MSRVILVNNPNGSIEALNRKALRAMPFFLLTNPPDNTITVPANSVATPTAMSISGEGPCNVAGFAATWTDPKLRVKIAIQDGQNPRYLCNVALKVDTIFGDRFRPYPLPEPIFVDELRRIFLEVTDASGATNTFRAAGISERLLDGGIDASMAEARKEQEPRQFLKLPAFYTLDEGQVTLAQGETVEKTISVGGDAHFLLKQLSGVSTGGYHLNILDLASGESFMDAPQGENYGLSNALVVGTAQYPFCLRQSRLYQVNQRILVRLTNDYAGDNVIDLTLAGSAIADRMWR